MTAAAERRIERGMVECLGRGGAQMRAGVSTDRSSAAEDGLDVETLAEALRGAAADMQGVAGRRAPALRDVGLDDVADDIEALAARVTSAAQELAAAGQPLDGYVEPGADAASTEDEAAASVTLEDTRTTQLKRRESPLH